MAYEILSLQERPDLGPEVSRIHQKIWPKFLLQSPISKRYWNNLLLIFPSYQLVLLEGGRVIGAAHSIPIKWVGALEDLPGGWDSALEKGFEDNQQALRPTTLVGLSVVIIPEYQGKNLSRMLLCTLKDTALRQEIPLLIMPVRPLFKSKYPQISMTDYLGKFQRDGLPFDPWVRTHLKLGAQFISIAHRFLVITGTISDWEEWTGMEFKRSGKFIVSGALVPVSISRKKNIGIYEEPNVWVKYNLGG